MATIVRPGMKREPPKPWYLTKEHICSHCDAVFTLDAGDFDGYRHSGGNWQDATWRVVQTARTPNGEQIIEGKCPYCHEKVRITGRMGGLA